MTTDQSNCLTTGGIDLNNQENPTFIQSDLWLVLHYASQGKLDLLDLRIVVALGTHTGIGHKQVAKILRKPSSTIYKRINKIRSLLLV